jgi:DNA (cytosine-5)-methyltransferase 1
MHRLTVLDLFSGCGGLSTGFQQAGLRVIAASDHDKSAAETYKANHPDVKDFILGDICSTRTRASIVAVAKGVNVVAGGVPCQSFSYAGSRSAHDHRAWLWKPFLKVVKKLAPRWVVVENVEGIENMTGGNVKMLTLIEHDFDKIGYRMSPARLDASLYGVPQLRERVFLLAARDGVPMPSFPTPLPGKPITVKQAIGDLRKRDTDKAFSHVKPVHTPEMIERFRRAKYGESVMGYRQSYQLLWPNRPAWTVTTNHSPFLHYDRSRTLTVRENARLQGFPDSFRFLGNTESQRTQVGNAVPPPLAKEVGLELVKVAGDKVNRSLYTRKPLAEPEDWEWKKAVAESQEHVAYFQKHEGEARSKQLLSTIAAFKVGRIIERVVFQGRKRGKRGEGRMKRFCDEVFRPDGRTFERGIHEGTGKNWHRLWKAARTLERLNRYDQISRKYWIELANFAAGDLFGWLATGTLLRWPLADEDGEPDHGKLTDAWKAFKNIRKRLSDHPFNITIDEDEVYRGEGLEVYVCPGKEPHVRPITDPSPLGLPDVEKYYHPGDRVEIHCWGDWAPSDWRKAAAIWERETSDWERTVSALVEGEEPSEEAKKDNLFRRWWLVYPPDAALRALNMDGPFAPLHLSWRETRTAEDVKVSEDRQEAAQTVAGWRRLAATLSDSDRERLSELVRIEHSAFQSFEVGAKVWCVASDTPYDRAFLSAESEALGKFCKKWLQDGGAAVLMVGSDHVDIALKGLTDGGLVYRWILGYVLPSGQGHAEKNRFPLVTQHKVKPVLLMAPSRNKPRSHVSDYVEAGEMDEALKELKKVFPHAQDVKGWRGLVKRYCPVDETVIDPCTGIGTTAVACLREKRRFIGCDKSEKAVGLAKLRVQAEYAAILQEAKTKAASAATAAKQPKPSS